MHLLYEEKRASSINWSNHSKRGGVTFNEFISTPCLESELIKGKCLSVDLTSTKVRTWKYWRFANVSIYLLSCPFTEQQPTSRPISSHAGKQLVCNGNANEQWFHRILQMKVMALFSSHYFVCQRMQEHWWQTIEFVTENTWWLVYSLAWKKTLLTLVGHVQSTHFPSMRLLDLSMAY